MSIHRLTAIAALSLGLAHGASGQPTAAATSESRDASMAYIGAANFVVGRVGSSCLSLLGRTETAQAFVGVWQQRNMKYLLASQKYLEARLAEAQANGGAEKKKAVMAEVSVAVRSGAEATVSGWLDRPDKRAACERALSLIESGAYDFSSTTPMYQELESLAAWAQR